jgi:hypothetical protein
MTARVRATTGNGPGESGPKGLGVPGPDQHRPQRAAAADEAARQCDRGSNADSQKEKRGRATPGSHHSGSSGSRHRRLTRLVSRGFWLGQTPVTVAAWKRYRESAGLPPLLTSDNIGRHQLNEASRDDSIPVVFITWPEAKNRLPRASATSVESGKSNSTRRSSLEFPNTSLRRFSEPGVSSLPYAALYARRAGSRSSSASARRAKTKSRAPGPPRCLSARQPPR